MTLFLVFSERQRKFGRKLDEEPLQFFNMLGDEPLDDELYAAAERFVQKVW